MSDDAVTTHLTTHLTTQRARDPLIGTRLPHADPALYVEEVVERTSQRLVCRGRLPRAMAATGAAGTTALLALELAAQASALWEEERDGESRPETALLVSIRRAELCELVPVATPLLVELTPQGGAGGLRKFACTVRLEGDDQRTLARADLATFSHPATTDRAVDPKS